MKKVIKGLFIFLFLVLLSGCTKDYKEITSTKFIDTFTEETEYSVNVQTQIYDFNAEKSVAASSEGVQFTFLVFESEKNAKSYVKTTYKDVEGYKYKDHGNYIEVKNSKRGTRVIQINKTVISGDTILRTSKNKKEIKRLFKKLGY